MFYVLMLFYAWNLMFNDQLPHTLGCIYLRHSSNTQGAHQLLHLPTDCAIAKLFLEVQGYEVTEKVVFRDSQS